MASPTDRATFKEYCLRKLGKPVINIEVDDTQVDDRVDEALETFYEKHYDATKDQWMTYKITDTDITNQYIELPEDIFVVQEIMSFNEILAHGNIFSYQYQIAMKELSPWTEFSQIDYYMNVTNYNSITDMTSAVPRFDFSVHERRLKIFRDLAELGVDYPLGIHVKTKIDENLVWNDKWLKSYATALIKLQWGENTKKFGQIQLLGGVTINGEQIYQEAREEIDRLNEILEETYMEPVMFSVV